MLCVLRTIHSADPVQNGQSKESGARTESCHVRRVCLLKTPSVFTDKDLRRLPLRWVGG